MRDPVPAILDYAIDSIEQALGLVEGVTKSAAEAQEAAARSAAPDITLTKVARATREDAKRVTGMLIEKGFIAKSARHEFEDTLEDADPAELVAALEKFASMAMRPISFIEDDGEPVRKQAGEEPSDKATENDRLWANSLAEAKAEFAGKS